MKKRRKGLGLKTKRKVFVITQALEKKSRFRTPHEVAKYWFWVEKDFDHPERPRTGKRGFLRASTEMEALDRLREAFPEIGFIQWVSRTDYQELKTKKKNV